MIFITGGAGSGQAEYAAEHFPGARVLGDYQQTVRRQLAEGEDPLAAAEVLLGENAGNPLVIWSCELGCGVVPLSAEDRAWREASGRVNCLFAEAAEQVIRTVCGVGTVIRRKSAACAEQPAVRKEARRIGDTAGRGADISPGDAGKTRRAKAILVAGTMSNAGKSFLAAGLCRLFTEDGYRVAPFKAQNMALNSFITGDGGEMGRSQVVQAEACRREPDVRMNPILLKPTTDRGSQVIVLGHPVADMDAREYYRHKAEFLPYVREAYESLAAENDIVVLEGAGSPAEINLRENDIVNMPMAALADAPVLLVGNIDPGGVFAQLYGTLMLLEPEEQDRIAGLIVNKFRGDLSILEPGLAMLEERCGKPVLGVLPYADIRLEPEDSLALEEPAEERPAGGDVLDIAVIWLPKLSNATDVEALRLEPDVRLRFVSGPGELETPDAIILPGTKSTISDLLWLRQSGLETAIRRAHGRGSFLVGICGGYQMLGRTIRDPQGAEHRGEVAGLGYLPVTTVFAPEKIMRQTETVSRFGIPALDGRRISGYEVHMGRGETPEPAADAEQSVIGTYIHGLFDEEEFREAFLELLCARRGRARGRRPERRTYREFKEKQLSDLAAMLREHLDIPAIYRIMGLQRDE